MMVVEVVGLAIVLHVSLWACGEPYLHFISLSVSQARVTGLGPVTKFVLLQVSRLTSNACCQQRGLSLHPRAKQPTKCSAPPGSSERARRRCQRAAPPRAQPLCRAARWEAAGNPAWVRMARVPCRIPCLSEQHVHLQGWCRRRLVRILLLWLSWLRVHACRASYTCPPLPAR